MKKVRRFIRQSNGVITTPSAVPVDEHLIILRERKQEHCSEALCIKDMQKDFSKDSGVVDVPNGDNSIVKVSWKIESLHKSHLAGK